MMLRLVLAMAWLAMVAHVQAAELVPSETALRQALFDHYPAAMGRDDLQEAFVGGFLFDAHMKVVRHSAALAPKRGSFTGMLFEMFPKLKSDECANAGLATVRAPRGVGGQFDRGVYSAWCILKEGSDVAVR